MRREKSKKAHESNARRVKGRGKRLIENNGRRVKEGRRKEGRRKSKER